MKKSKKRTKYTPNEIRINSEKNIAEIDVYDVWGRYRATGYISLKDVETIRPYKWYMDSTGYLRTTFPNGTKVRMHNMIIGEKNIDHKDRNKLNNTRENLRKCKRWQNCANTKQHNSAEIIGVYKTQTGSYVAQLEHMGKRKSKTYKTKQEAIIQRFIWDLNIFGEFSPQLEIIEQKYPLMILGLYLYPLKDDIETIHKIIDFYNGENNDCTFFERRNGNDR